MADIFEQIIVSKQRTKITEMEAELEKLYQLCEDLVEIDMEPGPDTFYDILRYEKVAERANHRLIMRDAKQSVK